MSDCEAKHEGQRSRWNQSAVKEGAEIQHCVCVCVCGEVFVCVEVFVLLSFRSRGHVLVFSRVADTKKPHTLYPPTFPSPLSPVCSAAGGQRSRAERQLGGSRSGGEAGNGSLRSEIGASDVSLVWMFLR